MTGRVLPRVSRVLAAPPPAAPTAVRLVGLSLGGLFVAQAAVESLQWLNRNDASRRSYLFLVATVVAVLTMTTLQLAARSARFAPTSLTVGAAAGIGAVALWAALASLRPAMPRDSGGGIVLIAAGASLAAVIVALRARTLRDTCAAGLLAAAVGVALMFSTAELTIQAFPGRIPDIVGPVMPAGSTAEQVLRENRIEIVDGYVPLLFLLAAALTGLLVVGWASRSGLVEASGRSRRRQSSGS